MRPESGRASDPDIKQRVRPMYPTAVEQGVAWELAGLGQVAPAVVQPTGRTPQAEHKPSIVPGEQPTEF